MNIGKCSYIQLKLLYVQFFSQTANLTDLHKTKFSRLHGEKSCWKTTSCCSSVYVHVCHFEYLGSVFMFVSLSKDFWGQWETLESISIFSKYNATTSSSSFIPSIYLSEALGQVEIFQCLNPAWSRCAETDTTQKKPQFVIARPNRSCQIWSVSTPCQEQERGNYLWQTNTAHNRHVWKRNQTKHWEPLAAQRTYIGTVDQLGLHSAGTSVCVIP